MRHHLLLLAAHQLLEVRGGGEVAQLELLDLTRERAHLLGDRFVASLRLREVVAQPLELGGEHGVLRRCRLDFLREHSDLLGQVPLLRLGTVALRARESTLEQLQLEVRVVHQLALPLRLIVQLADAAAGVARGALRAVYFGDHCGLLAPLRKELLRLLVHSLFEFGESSLCADCARVCIPRHALHFLARLFERERAPRVLLQLRLRAEQRALLPLERALLLVEQRVQVGGLVPLELQLRRRL
mmetsp:Transcript_2184/g.5430  ORF Transcript_2184/g.5430 Transcript_2184/m.5430 type:complete len:243 (-) Transcript_2184:1017-1745(-)